MYITVFIKKSQNVKTVPLPPLFKIKNHFFSKIKSLLPKVINFFSYAIFKKKKK